MFMILSLKGIIVLFFLIQQMQVLSTFNNLFSLINFNEALEIMNHCPLSALAGVVRKLCLKCLNTYSGTVVSGT